MRILLVRHGPSAQARVHGLLDRAAVDRWRTDYDAAGIASDAAPPVTLVAEVARADVVAASDLPRAAASATRLCPDRPLATTPLFREVPLAIPTIPGLRAPFVVWELLIHLRWGLDVLRGRDRSGDVRHRVRAAAHWCRTTCRRHGADATLVVVTHGVVRRLLARQLTDEGWELRGRGRSYAHWSVWELTSGGTVGSSRPLADER